MVLSAIAMRFTEYRSGVRGVQAFRWGNGFSADARIAAVTRADFTAGSSKAGTIEVWIDGTKYGESYEPLGTTNVKILNSFFYVPVGTHKVTIFAHMPDGTKIIKHRTVTVVNYAP